MTGDCGAVVPAVSSDAGSLLLSVVETRRLVAVVDVVEEVFVVLVAVTVP